MANYHLFCLTALLFLLPNAIFAATALQPAPAALVLAGCVGVAVFLWRGRPAGGLCAAPLDPAKLGACLAAGWGLCLLGGEGHFFHANWDWLMRDAVLADLVRDGVMPFYRYEGQDYFLRAPLGMYLLPAAVGRALGLFAAHLTLLAANGTIFGSILYLAGCLAGGRALIVLALVIGFGGLDILGFLAGRALSLGDEEITNQALEWWARAFAPDVLLQYSSMVTQLFWVPNHAAPGWFVGILVLLRARDEIRLSTVIACCAPLVIWSPLAVVGAIPLVAAVALQRPLRSSLSMENLVAVATGLTFLPVAAYLLIGDGAIANGWLISRAGFAVIYLPFLLIEIPQAAVLLYAWRQIEPVDRPALVAALATLCLLPFYNFGPGNDLVMRASIPALFLLAFSFARLAAATPRDNSALPTAISCLVILSAVTVAVQLKQLTAGRFAISDCNMLTSWQSFTPWGFPSNYLAPKESAPRWLLSRDVPAEPTRIEYRDCWPDHPFRRSLRRDGE